MERNILHLQADARIRFPAPSNRAAGRLVCVPLLEDRLPARQSRIFSLQRCRYAQSSAHSTGSGNEALATLRIFRPVSAYAGGIAGHVSSAASLDQTENSTRPRIPFWMQASISVGAARLPRFHVGSGWSGAGSLHVAGRPTRDAGAGLDSMASRALLEIDCGGGRHCLFRGTVQQSTVWIFT